MKHFIVSLLIFFTSTAAMALTIQPIYESNITNDPNGPAIKAAISYAIQMYQNEYADNVTINIQIGYGSVIGTACTGVLAFEGAYWGAYPIAQVKDALAKQGKSPEDISALNSLGMNNFPMSTSSINLSPSQQKALGFRAANDAGIDSYICIAADKPWDFNVSDGISSGAYDLSGVVLHEMGHSFGRTSALPGGSVPTLFDLYRFNSPGVRSYNVYEAAYFSVDNGNTNLQNFATNGEAGSWVATPGDVYSYAAYSGMINTLTPVDYVVVDILGFTRKAYAGSVPPVISPTPSPTPSPSLEAPLAPTNLKLKLSSVGKKSNPNYRVDLAWSQSTSSSVSLNRIYRRVGAGSWSVVATVSASTSYRDSNTQRGQSYTYRVTAINSSGLESTTSTNEASVTLP